VALVIGCVIALVSFGMFAGGAVLLIADRIGRDDAGFLGTGSEQFTTNQRALVSDRVVIDSGANFEALDNVIGDVRVRITNRAGQPIFVGIASEQNAKRYLSGTGYDEVTDLNPTDYRRHAGTQTPAPPAQQSIWVASKSGPGTQSVVWPITEGRWVIVVMNPDASPGIAVDASIAAKLPILTWLSVFLLIVGAIGLAVAAVIITLAVRRRPHQASAPSAGAPDVSGPSA
jgi:hypothetical protein